MLGSNMRAGRVRLQELCLWVSFCTALLAARPVEAQADKLPNSDRLTAPHLFPEDTLAYVRIDDVRQLKADLGRSTLGKLGNDDQLAPILNEFYGSLVRNTAEMQDAIGLNLDELLSIPSGELALAMVAFEANRSSDEEDDDDSSQRSRLRPTLAMLLDAGDEITSVQVLLARLEGQAENMVHDEKSIDRLTLHRFQNPNRRQQQFAYFIDDGVMVASSDAQFLEQLAATWLGQGAESSLADNRDFTAIMSRCVGTDGERPQVSFYVDPLEIFRRFATGNAVFALSMLGPLGLDGIEGLGGSWIVSPPDFDSIAHLHVQLGSPRRAVLGLLRPKSGSTLPEPWVPDSVAGYSTINWDFAATLQGVERLFNQFRGEDALEQQIFQPAGERVGIDIRRDILANLQGRVTIVQGFVRPVRINSGSNVYAIKLLNPEYFKANVLPKLMQAVEERTTVTTEGFGKLQAYVFVPGRGNRSTEAPIRQPEICVAMLEDYVVISDSKYMLRQVADCLSGSTPPLKDSLEYQLISDRIAAQLQERECSAISFARPEESLQLFYELARDPKNRERLKQVADKNGFFKALLTALEKHELPPFSVVAQYLAPGGGYLVDEETGLHYMSFSLRRE